jgi:type I site-specific restriction endonuclease
MDAWMWVVLIVLAVGVVVFAWKMWQRQRTDLLKERFGPEYDRTVAEADERGEAEKELLEREKRHEKLDIRPLSAESRARYQDEWQRVQARFVDDPNGAVREADGLVARVMEERGYPAYDDPEARAADLSVEHANVVGEYRRGHELLEGIDESEDATERLREAMQCFRTAFEDLLDDREVART